MAGINKVIIVGNLGQEVETRNTQDGNTISQLNVATSETWTDRNTGQRNDKTEWHRIVIFGKLAEIASQYLHKGSKVYIEGKLQTRKWQDKTGADRYTTEIVVSGYNCALQMLDNKSNNNTDSYNNYNSNNSNPVTQEATPTPTPKKANANIVTPLAQPDDFEDDIPF